MMSILAVKCDRCGERVYVGRERCVVGFRLRDGRQINVCDRCLVLLGSISESGDKAAEEEYFKALDV